MLSKLDYQPEYFEFLFAASRTAPLYAVSDGNHYRDIESAIQRCREALMVRDLKYYAVITKDNCPTTPEELDVMWKSIDENIVKERQPEQTLEVVDGAKAKDAFEEYKKAKDATKKNQKKQG